MQRMAHHYRSQRRKKYNRERKGAAFADNDKNDVFPLFIVLSALSFLKGRSTVKQQTFADIYSMF